MSITTQLVGEDKSKGPALVKEGALVITERQIPETNPPFLRVPFSTEFTNSAGSSDMRVDGSTTSVEFSIPAEGTNSIYISSIAFIIADQNATLDKFGTLTALTNGCTLSYFSGESGTITIKDELKTTFDFVLLCQGNPPFNGTGGAFRANNVSGNSEGYLPALKFDAVFGLPDGLLLRGDSRDRITITINDDVTGVDRFQAFAYGTRVLPTSSENSL